MTAAADPPGWALRLNQRDARRRPRCHVCGHKRVVATEAARSAAHTLTGCRRGSHATTTTRTTRTRTMPHKPMSVCAQPGCPTLTRNRRCPEHQAEQYRHDRQQRGSTTDRGLGWTHQQHAKRVLANATVCAICGQPPRPDDPLEADHITPRSDGGRNTRDNYRAAHASCNRGRRHDTPVDRPDDDPPSLPVFA